MGWRGGLVRRRPHWREGRWRLRLAPIAAGEDNRGEGGSKSGNSSGLAGLTMEGENGDDNGQKHAEEGRGGSVAGVDERRLTWPCAEESEGEKKRGEHGGVGQLSFERRRGDAGEG
jgi:hypothetical protein